MVIPLADLEFEKALKIIEGMTSLATRYWFGAAAVNEVAKSDSATLQAINRTPWFWIAVSRGLEYQGILSVGKIFGPRKANPYNIDNLFDVIRRNHSAVFSADALIARKRRMSANADEWLPDFMKRAHIPTIEEMNALYMLSKPHRRVYETQWKKIRDNEVAHLGVIDEGARWEMFQLTRIPDLEKLIVFLNDLCGLLWGMYHNGHRPVFESTTHSVESLVAMELGHLGQVRNEEYIVAEARKCMTLLKAGSLKEAN